MRKRNIKICSLILSLSMLCTIGGYPTKALAENSKNSFPSIISFEDGEELNYKLEADNVEFKSVNKGNTIGGKALQVDYNVGDWPGIKIQPRDEAYWNLGEDGALSFDVTNPMDRAQAFNIKLDEGKTSGSGNDTSVTFTANVPANSTVTFNVAIGGEVPELGMATLPPNESGRLASFGWGKKDIDLSHITQITFWLLNNTKESTLIYDNIKVISNPNTDLSYMDNILDQYGQYTKNTWENKVTSDEELKESVEDENKKLDSQIKDIESKGNLSTYGGWKNEDYRQEATGRFYTAKVDGKWTLIDPEGYPYIATGLDIIRTDDMLTWVSGRENMFKDIPSKDGELGDHYREVSNTLKPPHGLKEGDAFNFYTANLERKYGKDYIEKWTETTLKRFKAWGFTSLGCWAEPEIYFGKGEENKIPYVANGWINGDHARLKNLSRGGTIADPFDPEFRESTVKMAQNVKSYGVNQDQWCFGIYVDNEIEWGNGEVEEQHYSVIDGVFLMDANDENSYAKRAFIDILKNKYTTIESLNKSWNTEIQSFEFLELPYDGKIGDKSELLSALADKYYRTVDEVLNEELPDVLYLGSRLAHWGTSKEVVQACAKYVDVVSFNCYKPDVNQSWMNLGSYDKPIIIGEFHFNAMDSGFFAPGLQPVSSQEERGQAYSDYMKSVFESEYFVGAQWFQYYDQPVLGRAWDGENTNAGFVDVADQPYEPLVKAAKDINEKSYDMKFSYEPVEDIKLNNNTIELTNENDSIDLNVEVVPNTATNKTVTWESSDESVAIVDSNGKVTAVGNGYATIIVKSNINEFAIDTCGVKVSGFEEISNVNFDKISFEEEETNNITVAGNGNAEFEIISNKDTVESEENNTDVLEEDKSEILDNAEENLENNSEGENVIQGITEGNNALKITLNKLSGDDSSSTIDISADDTWNFGSNNILHLDITNPNEYEIQARINIKDNSGQIRTYYYVIKPLETRTVSIDNFEKAPANWGDDGFWGAEEGLDTENIDLISIFLWEADSNLGQEPISFMVDNINIEKIVNEVVIPTTLTLNKNNIKLKVDESESLEVIINPEDANDDTVKWTSSNSDIVVVDDKGNITAKNAGIAYIGVESTVNKLAKDYCKVIVENNEEEPEKPIEPEKPVNPEKPVEPEKPVNPEEPVNPEDPTQPEDQLDPDSEDKVETIPETGGVNSLYIVIISGILVILGTLIVNKKEKITKTK